ncbi:uncharacterized protein MELLADRAFT_108752 [Melampsora larici-populina 98AG31]|uniref:Secreted protein n=1 Tax=Melampsora larici-populina (strain 98AG31 / pathotype 3-4-7) TaxID=747676 RepID=F4RU47_MELLP|nr:uncharacterized protein MELLADRAFT_108752 [Melampsora larici-populina 98AG31]EGG04112.1 hypothetical protein MELLADRAFT_108752 [Melampsora larici-populina 98AG31]
MKFLLYLSIFSARVLSKPDKVTSQNTGCHRYMLNEFKCVPSAEKSRCPGHNQTSCRRKRRNYDSKTTLGVCLWSGSDPVDGSKASTSGWLNGYMRIFLFKPLPRVADLIPFNIKSGLKTNCGKFVFIQRKGKPETIRYAKVLDGCAFDTKDPKVGCFQLWMTTALFNEFKPSKEDSAKGSISDSFTWGFRAESKTWRWEVLITSSTSPTVRFSTNAIPSAFSSLMNQTRGKEAVKTSLESTIGSSPPPLAEAKRVRLWNQDVLSKSVNIASQDTGCYRYMLENYQCVPSADKDRCPVAEFETDKVTKFPGLGYNTTIPVKPVAGGNGICGNYDSKTTLGVCLWSGSDAVDGSKASTSGWLNGYMRIFLSKPLSLVANLIQFNIKSGLKTNCGKDRIRRSRNKQNNKETFFFRQANLVANGS